MSQLDILTTREVASRYGVSLHVPSKWVREGRLGKEGKIWFRTPGGEYRFRVRELDQLDMGRTEE